MFHTSYKKPSITLYVENWTARKHGYPEDYQSTLAPEMSNRIAQKEKLLFSEISLDVFPSYPPLKAKIIISFVIHLFIPSFNKWSVTMYHSTGIMLEADQVCSLIITSLKEGNIFYLKEEYIVLKIEAGHLSGWITI